jgi:hypothetical protein
MTKKQNLDKWIKKDVNVSSHKRYDPRKGKKVNVSSYRRKQNVKTNQRRAKAIKASKETSKPKKEHEYKGLLTKTTKSGKRYIEWDDFQGISGGTTKAWRTKGKYPVWIPKSQSIRSSKKKGSKLYVEEWLWPKLKEQKIENEIKLTQDYIKEEKNEIKKLKKQLKDPPEFSSLSPKMIKEEIKDSKKEIERLKKKRLEPQKEILSKFKKEFHEELENDK